MNTNTSLNTWYASIIEKGQAKAICPNQLQSSNKRVTKSNVSKQAATNIKTDSFDSILGSVFK
jgi:hypothetical protein